MSMACNKCVYASSTPYLWIHFACCIVIIIFLLFRNIRKLYFRRCIIIVVIARVAFGMHKTGTTKTRFLLCFHAWKEKLFVHIFVALSLMCAHRFFCVFYDMQGIILRYLFANPFEYVVHRAH